MTMKSLIGYDGSECAMAAIEDLRWAGLPDHAEASVLTVADVWLPATPEPDRSEADPVLYPAVSAARALAAQAVEDAKALSHDGAARVRACFDSVCRAKRLGERLPDAHGDRTHAASRVHRVEIPRLPAV